MASSDHGTQENLVATYPLFATVAVAVIAFVAYVAIQLVFDGRIDPVETLGFTAGFTAVYVVFHLVQEWVVSRGSGDEPTDDAADAATAVDDPVERTSE